jgi:hypothetical protein
MGVLVGIVVALQRKLRIILLQQFSQIKGWVLLPLRAFVKNLKLHVIRIIRSALIEYGKFL